MKNNDKIKIEMSTWSKVSLAISLLSTVETSAETPFLGWRRF